MILNLSDLPTLLGLLSFVVAIVFPLVLNWFSGRKKLLELQLKQEQISRKADETLYKADAILREVREATAAHHVRPELSTYFAKQWRFIERTFYCRYEKHGICRRIVSDCIRNNNTILLDSGSTVDLVTFELLTSDVDNVKVISNNLFAAMHLIGTERVRFQLLSGWFNDNFAAVYDDESTARISGLPIDLFILAATTIRFNEGIMVHDKDISNLSFKASALKTFQKNKASTLIIAVDASKFIEPTTRKRGVLPLSEWQDICNQECKRIVIVTSTVRYDSKMEERNTIEGELEKFRNSGIQILYAVDFAKET